ncbi:MAG: hypothetical protein DRJ05_01450 [Bacteroidetes bacterium]|nr:MAG: hypothetical protein DRJ05_01450 [Bacteroidota bacterium]
MKHILKITGIIALAFLLVYPNSVSAQGKIELSPLVGYQFGGKLRMYEGDLKIKDDMNYGLAISTEMAQDTRLEFIWTSMQTSADFRPYYGYGYLEGGFDLNINYYQIGGLKEFPSGGAVVPFGEFTMGAVQFTPSDVNVSETWRFSVALGGGAKIWLSDRIGIRLQGRLLMPLYFQGVSLYAGTGGSGMGVGAGVPILQGDFMAGLIFAFGD